MPDDVKQLLKEIHCLNLIGDWDNEDAQTLINRGAELYNLVSRKPRSL